MRPGDVVSLTLRWGSQQRLKCPRCKRFIARSDGDLACRCGTTYRAREDQFEVVSIGAQ